MKLKFSSTTNIQVGCTPCIRTVQAKTSAANDRRLQKVSHQDGLLFRIESFLKSGEGSGEEKEERGKGKEKEEKEEEEDIPCPLLSGYFHRFLICQLSAPASVRKRRSEPVSEIATHLGAKEARPSTHHGRSQR